MVRIKTASFLLPSPTSITSTTWYMVVDGVEQELVSILPHWDPATSISTRASMQINTAQVWEECKLSDNDALRLAMIWYSYGTGLKGRGSFIDISAPASTQTVFLEAVIDGTMLADKVRLEIQLVLSRPGRSDHKLSPHLPGTILWREEKTIIIEGQGSRFPSESVSFANSGWMPPKSDQNTKWR